MTDDASCPKIRHLLEIAHPACFLGGKESYRFMLYLTLTSLTFSTWEMLLVLHWGQTSVCDPHSTHTLAFCGS